jgi:4-hydroxy-3-methylbut-2-enyl diphosphate reductase
MATRPKIMKMKINKLRETGFCYGVKRAIDLLEKSAVEYGSVDCLGDLVHNSQVMQKLKSKGIRVVNSPADCTSPAVAISAHGVSPQVEDELNAKKAILIDATCPSVKKVQKAARRLAKNGYTVVVFGDVRHSEVMGILGWAQGQGIAALEPEMIFHKQPWPRKIGILAQTTQVPENYLKFVKAILDRAMIDNSEITILDTICREVRRRQSLSQSLAAESDLMLMVGGRNSANSRRLTELCTALTETHWIENASEIEQAWLSGKSSIGITSGTSTSEEDIDAVSARLKQLIL